MAKVTLLVPGLLALAPEDATGAQRAELSLPALELLLARAAASRPETDPRAPYESLLCGLFGIRRIADGDLPVAALTHLVDFDRGHEGAWLRADPVHLRPDLGRLLLFDATVFDLELEEAQALAAEVNAAAMGEGLRLMLGRHPSRWYCRLNRVPALSTCSPAAASGEHIDPFLPTGPESRSWHRLANEIQMLLHQSAVNQAREARGMLPINSLWFWGAGVLPPCPIVPWTKLWASDALARALASLCACPLADTPDGAPAVIEAADPAALVVVEVGHRFSRGPWAHPLFAELEHAWFAPLLAALRRGRLDSVTLCTEGHRFSLTRAGLWRVWRRRRSVRQRLKAGSAPL